MSIGKIDLAKLILVKIDFEVICFMFGCFYHKNKLVVDLIITQKRPKIALTQIQF